MSSTCALSGIAAPDVVTLAALANGDDSAAVIVSPDCSETQVDAVASTEEPGEYMLNVSYAGVEAVASYPKVVSLWLWFNQISAFKGDGATVKYIDLSSNQMTTLDGMDLPSSTQRLILDLNAIASTRASDFPDSLLSLYLRKNVISSLAKFRFPPALQTLYLTGNTQLQSLSGAVFPDTLATLDCTNCGITEITGVVFPSSLKTLTLSGATVTTFEIRESDVAVFETASVQMTSSVSSCSTSGATLTTVKDGIQACVLDDVTFSTLYPDASGSGSASSTTSSDSSPSSSTSAVSSGTGGDSAIASAPTDSISGGSSAASTSSSSSKAGVYGGIAAGIVVVLLLVVAFVIYRRRRARQDKSADQPPASNATTTLTYGMPPSSNGMGDSKGTASRTRGTESVTLTGGQPPSSSSGYMANDVRNDESLVPYRLPVDEIEVVRELAVGGFGVVFLATLRHDKRHVVVKRLKGSSSNSNSEALRRFMGEIQLCARLEHPKIVRFVGVAWTNLLDLSLVLEFMPRGDLSGLLKRVQKTDLRATAVKRRSNSPSDKNNRYRAYDSDDSNEDEAADPSAAVFSWFDPRSEPRAKIDLALDVAEAVVYLHSFPAPIIHRDLKAKNVLLSETFEAKLSDFGVSRERKAGAGGNLLSDDDLDDASTMTGGMGTTAWIAPEVLQGERYSEKADVFSFGILLAELDACGHPYNNLHSDRKLTDAKIAMLVSSDALKPSLARDCPPGVRNLVLRCVSFDARDRPSAVELHYELRKLKAASQRQPSSLSSNSSRYHQGFI